MGGGGGSTTIFSMLFSQQCFKFMYYKEICCEICFLPEDRGQQWLKFMSENEPQRDSARDNDPLSKLFKWFQSIAYRGHTG